MRQSSKITAFEAVLHYNTVGLNLALCQYIYIVYIVFYP